jgi:anaerobic ribonucleoside-triphosphate reductase
MSAHASRAGGLIRTEPGRRITMIKCDAKTEVYSRVCGFFRPVQQWNKGKKEEFKDRQEYVVAEGKG